MKLGLIRLTTLLLEPLAALHANVSFTPKAKLFLKHQP